MDRAQYMREYRRRRKAHGAVLSEGVLQGGDLNEVSFPRCYWREPLTEPVRTPANPYGDHTVEYRYGRTRP
jgi:hypothetical protein